MPLLSVVVPVELTVQVSEQTLLSLLGQLPDESELILVGLTSCGNAIPDIPDRLRQQKQVRWVTSVPNLASAYEVGRLNARGRYLLYLDSIATQNTLHLRENCRYLDAHLECDAVAAPGSVFDFSELLINPDASIHGWVLRRARWDLLGPWFSSPIATSWEYLMRALTQKFVVVASPLSENSTVKKTAWRSRRLYDQSAVTDYLHALAIQSGRVVEAVDTYLSTKSTQARPDRQALSQLLFRYSCACGRHHMPSEARAFLSMSIQINQRKTVQHRAYIKLVKLLGWRRAATLLHR